MIQQILDFVGQMGGKVGADTEKRLMEVFSGGNGKVDEGEFQALLEGLLEKLEALGLADGGKDLPLAEQKELLMKLLSEGGDGKAVPLEAGRSQGAKSGSGAMPMPQGSLRELNPVLAQGARAEGGLREESGNTQSRFPVFQPSSTSTSTGPATSLDLSGLFRAQPAGAEPLVTQGQGRNELAGLLAEGGLRGGQMSSGEGEENRGGREGRSGANPASIQSLSGALASVSDNSSAQRLPPIQTPVGQGRAWAQALGQRVTMMQAQGMERAEVRLHPPNLGPLEIRLSMTQDQTQLTLSSQHAVTREALESALPRLREMLQEEGIELGDATVTDGREESAMADDEGETGENSTDSQSQGRAGAAPQESKAQEIRVGLLDEYV